MKPLEPKAYLSPDASLVGRMVSVPGLIKPGVTIFDGIMKLPLHPLYLENIYADPRLLLDIAAFGDFAAQRDGIDVIVGAESAGIPLGTAIALRANLSFAFVRREGYRGHVRAEPMIRGTDVNGKRVMLVDDAVWRGTSLRGFADQILSAGGTLASVFTFVDMRELAMAAWNENRAQIDSLETLYSCGTYRDVIDQAAAGGIISTNLHRLVRSCIDEEWAEDDPRWADLICISGVH